MKKIIILLFFIIFVCFIVNGFNFKQNKNYICYAKEDLQSDLMEETEKQISEWDFDLIDEKLESEEVNFSEYAKGETFADLIKKIISGEETFSIDTFIKSLGNGLKNTIGTFVPYFLSIFIIIFIYHIFCNLSKETSTVPQVVYLICFAQIIIILLVLCVKSITKVSESISLMNGQMQVVFPILLTLITALGGVSTVAMLQPFVAIMSMAISSIFSGILLPAIMFCFVFTIIGKISSNFSLKKFVDFLSSLFKWILGGVCSIFLTFLSFKGITSGGVDGLSIKATKYALKNYIPFLGGYLSEGFEMIKAGSTLLKNSLGVGSLFILAIIVLSPLVYIFIFKMLLKLLSAVCSPMCDAKFCLLFDELSKCLNMLISIMLAVFLMYALTLVLIIISVNYVF